MLPPPERSARKIVRTASGEIEWRIATREMNPSSLIGMVISPMFLPLIFLSAGAEGLDGQKR
jgi:hypothetical protein